MTDLDRRKASDRRARPGRVALVSILVSLACASLGCASRGIIVSTSAGSLENPPEGPAVLVREVRDARVFQETANRKQTPSLTGDARAPGARARAVGRQTNAAGRPGANVMLAAGQSVESLVGDAVARALRGAGFRVVQAGDADLAAARRLDVSIEELWMWETVPSMGAVTNVRLRVRLSGPLPALEAGEAIEAGHKLVSGGFTYDMWRQTLERGLDEWTQRAEGRLSEVRRAVPAGASGDAPAQSAAASAAR